jgi:glycine hydroxymethyltransferase
MQPEFRSYQAEVKANARRLAGALAARGYKIVSGGTDNHMFLLDLIDKNVTGKDADAVLGSANITVNKNAVPNDPRSPFVTSGLRMGTPAITTRGCGAPEVTLLAGWIADILDNITDESRVGRVRSEVLELCRRFPVYG